MLLNEAPADTLNYMILGFGVIFVFIAGLIVSLIARFRSLHRDLQLLDELGKRDAEYESRDRRAAGELWP